ncbi:hypothetical protein GCM10007385_07740 [Tateyamaria omphalii]|uniref:DUF1801 domain-containing protein n=1 Tax=Tateyamaria omphalii TaxID=299262 RepID=UPI001672636B|nr:DUF1801 domain-containing protein [Tateyamaria omphalii]GGX42507.1 hypothetical protein GCM10007385_07740 [Tateyamaria omphalii]
MAEAKTKLLNVDFPNWVTEVEPEVRQAEALQLDDLFRRVTGFEPQIWTGGIVGYGAYDYTYASGRSGTWMATGFAPRKAKLSIYIMPGYADFGPILERLGPHSKGKSCLYITRLERVDMDVLGELIAAGLRDLATHWPVRARAELDNARPL